MPDIPPVKPESQFLSQVSTIDEFSTPEEDIASIGVFLTGVRSGQVEPIPWCREGLSRIVSDSLRALYHKLLREGAEYSGDRAEAFSSVLWQANQGKNNPNLDDPHYSVQIAMDTRDFFFTFFVPDYLQSMLKHTDHKKMIAMPHYDSLLAAQIDRFDGQEQISQEDQRELYKNTLGSLRLLRFSLDRGVHATADYQKFSRDVQRIQDLFSKVNKAIPLLTTAIHQDPSSLLLRPGRYISGQQNAVEKELFKANPALFMAAIGGDMDECRALVMDELHNKLTGLKHYKELDDIRAGPGKKGPPIDFSNESQDRIAQFLNASPSWGEVMERHCYSDNDPKNMGRSPRYQELEELSEHSKEIKFWQFWLGGSYDLNVLTGKFDKRA